MDLAISKKFEFLDSKPRLKTLFLLLFRADDFITSEELAKQLKVSARTIKSDIKFLKEEMTGKEMTIVSKRSLGYRLELSVAADENKIREFFQIYPSATIESEFDHRVYYILRRFLSANQPIKIETLQKELVVNYSLSRELQQVKKILADYGLILAVRPHYGMQIKGENFKKVMLIVRMYRYFDKNASNDFGITEYNQFFICAADEKEKIRQTLFKTIMKSRIVFSDINAERFIVYLLYFRNHQLQNKMIELELPPIIFDFKMTDEYALVIELLQKLRSQFAGFEFSAEIIQFLAYIAIFSTDLYRFIDCSKEKYDCLIELAEEMRNFLLKEAAACLQIDTFDDYTCLKDLLKIMIPISLKVMLNVSDSIDLRYKDFNDNGNQPVLRFYLKKIYQHFSTRYHYHFSKREQHLIFLTFCGLLNRIILEHKKLRLAIIAIDGRLSTQQLKFNLQHYYADFIERIETRVLYELDSINHSSYDYYICSNYGKNLNIMHTPIHYIEEEMNELEYVDSLQHIFFQAFEYEKRLPAINFYSAAQAEPEFSDVAYDVLQLNGEHTIRLCLNFSAEKEAVTIVQFQRTDEPAQYVFYIDLQINEDKQKLKMLLNCLNSLLTYPEKLAELSTLSKIEYGYFLI